MQRVHRLCPCKKPVIELQKLQSSAFVPSDNYYPHNIYCLKDLRVYGIQNNWATINQDLEELINYKVNSIKKKKKKEKRKRKKRSRNALSSTYEDTENKFNKNFHRRNCFSVG